MTKRKHTPGPWHHDGAGNITHADEQPIAFVNWTAYGSGIANARLIATAPDLLDALQDIANHHEHQRDLWSSEECADADQARYHEEQRDVAIAAIAKATDSVWRQDLKD